MAYTPLYTSIDRVIGLTQVQIDDESVPSFDEVMVFVEDFEKRIVDRGLGSHSSGTIYINVPNEWTGYNSVDWVYNARQGQIIMSMPSGVMIPLLDVKNPIISITSLAKNNNALDDAPSWDSLTEWDGSSGSTHYMLLKGGKRDLGYALYIYDQTPLAGPNRLKMVYTYGHNVDENILGDFCTYGVGVKVLQALQGTNEVSGMSMYDGGELGSYIPRSLTDRIRGFYAEMDKIEKRHFPETKHDIAFEVV